MNKYLFLGINIKNIFSDVLLMSGHNICFSGDIRKNTNCWLKNSYLGTLSPPSGLLALCIDTFVSN